MPYPVPPSEPPAIVRTPLHSATIDQTSQPAIPHLISSPQPVIPAVVASPKRVARLKPLASPSKPEVFKAEYTATTAVKRAADLGAPVSVGVAESELYTLNDLDPNSVGFNHPLTELKSTVAEKWQFQVAHQDLALPSLAKRTFQLETPAKQSAFLTAQSPAPAPPPPASEQPTPVEIGGVIELTADQQTYDSDNRVFTAQGNVLMRFRGGVLKSDRLRVNLGNRVALAEGNVVLNRGEQILQGDRLDYNFIQGTGVLLNASGVLYTPTSGSDLSLEGNKIPVSTLGDRLQTSQPVQQITNPGEVTFGVGAGRDAPSTQLTGQIRRVRYEAERVDFTATGWIARNVRITNDPFSPPELELRADQAQFTQTAPNEGLLETSQTRLVFDQGFSIPLLQSRSVIGRQRRGSGLFRIGYDGTDRGGLFVEQTFELSNTEQLQWTITPQFLVQRAFSETSLTSPTAYGVSSEINYNLGPRTSVRGTAVLPTLDFNQLENRLRASLRARQLVGDHSLSLEYSYRDRLFNGSLGFQDVQSSLGVLLVSPVINLGGTGTYGPILTYQAGLQLINADTDRQDLLPVPGGRRNTRVDLGRFQATAELSQPFVLWRGDALPPTPEEGMKYTATPLVPYVQIVTQIRGVTNAYSNGDNQQTLTGSVGLEGQLGNFSRPFLDYTAFNIRYVQTALSGLSPFLFDRTVDNRVLVAGFAQQVYGPFRVGVQTAINLDTGREISTDYTLEYSRRTYGITLRYNPTLQFGALGLRISDFNWTGGTESFAGNEIQTVEDGVRRSRN